MDCPVCKLEAVITKTTRVLDQREMKLYNVLHFSCRNKNCKEFNKEIGEVKNELPFEIQD